MDQMEALKLLLAYFSVFTECVKSQNLYHHGDLIDNNSFIVVTDICGGGASPLQCRTKNTSCCSETSQWIDLRYRNGSVVQNVTDEKCCLYVNREHESLSLNCKTSCTNLTTSGMWGCDISGSSGERQSIYIYIGNNKDLCKVHLYI